MTLARTRDRHRDGPENPPSVIDILFRLRVEVSLGLGMKPRRRFTQVTGRAGTKRAP